MAQEIILMVGESGSGKSTWARQYCLDHPDYDRLSRDDLRIELASDPKAPAGRDFEKYVIKVQKARTLAALDLGRSVIIDDTNLNPKTRLSWENFARECADFKIQRMETPLAVCIANDAKRNGKSHVGRAVIERQFLLSGRLPIGQNRPIAIVDVDGTLANHHGLRSPYDEHLVHLDRPYDTIIRWVRELSQDHTILIVSGRHSTCGDATAQWLEDQKVPFNHIFMRHSWDNRSDVIVKQEILDELLGIVDKAQIRFVLDDRPRVVKNWKANGLKVIPVRGGTDHTPGCVESYTGDTCLCGALKDF